MSGSVMAIAAGTSLALLAIGSLLSFGKAAVLSMPALAIQELTNFCFLQECKQAALDSDVAQVPTLNLLLLVIGGKTHKIRGLVLLPSWTSPSVARLYDTTGSTCWTTDLLLLLVVEDYMSLSIDIQCVAVKPCDKEIIAEGRHSTACCICHGDISRDWLLHAFCIYKIHSGHTVVDTFNPDTQVIIKR